jgi:hypothetical protein
MPVLTIALPYAVSIRDFVSSGALKSLAERIQGGIVILTLNPDAPELSAAREMGVEVRAFRPYVDSRLERILKSVYPLFFADTFVYVAQMLAVRPVRRQMAVICVAVRKLVGTSRMIRLGAALLLWLYSSRRLQQQIPGDTALLLGTRSLINSLDYGLVAEAASRGMPLMTLAGSWDNFTTKGFFPFQARSTVVWNRKMVEELQELFEVPCSAIQVAGYPRARMLRSLGSRGSAQAYLEGLRITGFRRFILYSASYGELTRVPAYDLPLEYLVMQEVCRGLDARLPSDVCILVRLHPFSSESDAAAFAGLKRCHTFVPGRQDKYVERVMGMEDEAHLASQISLSECILSTASTISIDALTLGRPVLNLAVEPVKDLPASQRIARFYEFNHFRDLVRLVNLPIARTMEEVWSFVHSSLEGVRSGQTDIQNFETWYVPPESMMYADNVARIVAEVYEDCVRER